MKQIPLKYYQKLAAVIKYRDKNPYWLINGGSRARAGTIAGTIDKNGYRKIGCTIDGKRHSIKSSRLSFYIHNGYLPKWPLIVDHINQIKSDDRPENLREVTVSQNNRNSPKRKNTTSTYTGVTWHIPTNKWQARIQGNFGEIYIGVFHHEKDAAHIRDLTIIEYGFGLYNDLNFPNGTYEFIPETIFHIEPMYQPDLFNDLVPVKVTGWKHEGKGRSQQLGCGETHNNFSSKDKPVLPLPLDALEA